jgi:CAAX protease family protein
VSEAPPVSSLQPPPDPPELPEGVEPAPRWPPAYAVAAFFVGIAVSLVLVGIVAGVAGVDPGQNSPGVVIVGTLILEGSLIASALLFASFVAPPRPWHFGLRGTRLWPAVGWAALALFAFYVFAAVYWVLLHPDAKQQVTESLGANRGTVGLILAGIMVIAVAPAAEEFFFRGFFYRALRSRLPVYSAAAIDGVVFGLIHFDFSGTDALLILPPLAVLGFIFCLVYEKTGSLYPTIALHAVNNSIAYAAQAHGGAVAAVVGPLVVAGCLLAPRLLTPARRAAVPALR